MWLILAVSISKLFTKEKSKSSNWFVVGMMMLYPYWHMATAGWIATTTNFVWSLSLGMFALLTLKRAYEGVRLPIYRWVFFGLAMLYASDAEQNAMILFIVFFLLAAWLIYAKPATPLQYRVSLFGGLAFLTARLIFTLTTPGNHVRRLLGHYTVPGFEDFSIWHRFSLSFELTAVHYTQFTLALFPFFALFLLITVWRLHKSVFKRAIAAIPLVISMVLSGLMGINALIFARDNLAGYEGWFLDAFVLETLPDWPGSAIVFVAFFISLVYALWLSFERKKDSGLAIGIMAIGFISQIIMGFSPSLYGSAFRSFIYASFAIIICALLMYESGAKAYFGKWIKILLISACSANVAVTFAIGVIRYAV
jgi:hypothetical protein